jgi:hypothetical protein
MGKNSPRQMEIMHDKFYDILNTLETMPGIGSKYEDGMRRFLLGKFPYFIYYREHEDYLSIRGI